MPRCISYSWSAEGRDKIHVYSCMNYNQSDLHTAITQASFLSVTRLFSLPCPPANCAASLRGRHMCFGHMDPAHEEGMRFSSSECCLTVVRICHTSLLQYHHSTIASEMSLVLHSQTPCDLLGTRKSRLATFHSLPSFLRYPYSVPSISSARASRASSKCLTAKSHIFSPSSSTPHKKKK